MEQAKFESIDFYQAKSREMRESILRIIADSKTASHIGSSFSPVDIMSVLFHGVMRIDPKYPEHPDRDRFIMSKGHAAAALYAVLHQRGFLSKDDLLKFYQDGSTLGGHPSYRCVPGVEATSGSLGHGLPIGLGMALAGKRDAKDYRVFVLLSDGECDEGSNWEAILAAGHFGLDNLVVIVDYNKIQSFGSVKEVMDLEPLADKFKAFRWATREIDGHDTSEIISAMKSVPFETGKPTCIIAHTIKGKGVSFMENQLAWHYKTPQGEEVVQALRELEAS